MPTIKHDEISNNPEQQYNGNLDDTLEKKPKTKKIDGYAVSDFSQP